MKKLVARRTVVEMVLHLHTDHMELSIIFQVRAILQQKDFQTNFGTCDRQNMIRLVEGKLFDFKVL